MTEGPGKIKVPRRLAAILAADIAGYSALMGADDAGTVRSLKEHQAVVLPMITEHSGRVIDTAGDGILAEFGSVVNAVECAVAIQDELAQRNAKLRPNHSMEFRIGINLGDVIVDGSAIYGDGVNVAARLEGLAEGGGIMVSGSVFDLVRDKVEHLFVYEGRKRIKNISTPIAVYGIVPGHERAAFLRLRRRRKTALIGVGAALCAAVAGWAWMTFFPVVRAPPAAEVLPLHVFRDCPDCPCSKHRLELSGFDSGRLHPSVARALQGSHRLHAWLMIRANGRSRGSSATHLLVRPARRREAHGYKGGSPATRLSRPPQPPDIRRGRRSAPLERV